MGNDETGSHSSLVIETIKKRIISERKSRFYKFLRNFLLAWAVRGGVGLLSAILKLVQTRNKWLFLKAFKTAFGETALRSGLFLALFFGLFEGLEDRLRCALKDRERVPTFLAAAPNWVPSFLAGAAASLALIVEPEETRWILAQYLSVRALQCLCNSYRRTHPTLKRLTKHGDALLFILCSGQLVYGFVSRPETLDHGYAAFLERVAAFPTFVIETVRASIRRLPVDHGRIVRQYWHHQLPIPHALVMRNRHVITDCSFMHPGEACGGYAVDKWTRIFRMTFPMYLSLHLIPQLVFKFNRNLLDRLHRVLQHSLYNTAISATFMSTYVFIFQAILCLHNHLSLDYGIGRAFLQSPHRYWLIGAVSGFSVFIEKKHRRAELMLYLAPKAAVAFYRAIKDGRWNRDVPAGDLIMFSLAMGTIMAFYRNELDTISPTLAKILEKFLS